jgi:uncharacterized protein (DUF1919 family)
MKNKSNLGKKSSKFDLEAFVKWRIIDRICARFERSKLKNKDFSIIGNNCLVVGVYHKFGLKFTTPTVGLFFFSEDYIRFLENLEYCLKQSLIFKETSKFAEANELREIKHYPIGVLPDDIEIHFMHYKSQEEAIEKWNRRVKRINFENLFIIYSDGDRFREELLSRYEMLPYVHKIFFSSKPLGNRNYVVLVRDYENERRIGDSTRNRKYEKYFDLIKWLNGDQDFLKRA